MLTRKQAQSKNIKLVGKTLFKIDPNKIRVKLRKNGIYTLPTQTPFVTSVEKEYFSNESESASDMDVNDSDSEDFDVDEEDFGHFDEENFGHFDEEDVDEDGEPHSESFEDFDDEDDEDEDDEDDEDEDDEDEDDDNHIVINNTTQSIKNNYKEDEDEEEDEEDDDDDDDEDEDEEDNKEEDEDEEDEDNETIKDFLKTPSIIDTTNQVSDLNQIDNTNTNTNTNTINQSVNPFIPFKPSTSVFSSKRLVSKHKIPINKLYSVK